MQKSHCATVIYDLDSSLHAPANDIYTTRCSPRETASTTVSTTITTITTTISASMEDPQAPDTVGTEELPSEDEIVAKPRNYQVEMLEQSLQKNIIVAMDTGSGKTHVAVLRIRNELEKGNKKISWFLCPGVELARQQFRVLQESISNVHMQFLVGSCGVDHWSNQEVWDEVLGQEEAVIVSTHQVLADALAHGFVSMTRIGLLIFDEAHHCVQSHPARMIMENFYHPRRKQGQDVPAILGLTASPVMRADQSQLGKIEANLDAIARTPVLNREELMKYVHVPKLIIAYYGRDPIKATLSTSKSSSAAQPHKGTIQSPDQPVIAGWANHLDPSLNLDFDPGEPFAVPGFETAKAPSKPNAMSTGQISGQNKRRADRSSLTGLPDLKKLMPPKPVSHDEEYEQIDPLTGEPVVEGDPVVEDDDEFECVDAVTLEVVSSQQNTTEHQDSHFEQMFDDSDDCEEIVPETYFPVSRPSIAEPITRTSRALESLCSVYHSMDIRKDPFILKLQRSGNKRKQARAEILIANRRTYCQEQIKQLFNKSTHLFEEYGEWAADWFIHEAIQKFQKQNFLDGEELLDPEDTEDKDGYSMNNEDEHQYLLTVLGKVLLPVDLGPVENGITPKVEKLIEVLLEEYYAEQDRAQGEFSGLVFVEQRVGVLALAEIIKTHPKTKEYFRPGTMVGSSKYEKALRFLRDLTGNNQDKTLDDFREGKLNLIVATAVIEEGLDIQDCHLVVCFQPPHNLKSFVQRRGRARRVESSYIIMYPRSGGTTKAEEFEDLEKDMIKMYTDTLRELGDPEEEELGEEGQDRQMKVEKTGALLTLANSVPHLYHYCACLPPQEFVDLRPDFRTTKHPTGTTSAVWTAEVVLPANVHKDFRFFESTKPWKSEKWAKRDVAFEAVRKLHSVKQIDDNLMPLVKRELQSLQEAQKRAPKATVELQTDFWRSVCKKWENTKEVYISTIDMTFSSGEHIAIDMFLPLQSPEVEDLELHWTLEETVKVTFGQSISRPLAESSELLERARKATYRLFRNVHAKAIENKDDFTYLFLPRVGSGDMWDKYSETQINALDAFGKDIEMGIIRERNDDTGTGARFVFERWRTDINPLDLVASLEGDLAHQPVIEASRFTKRRDFLHKEAGQRKSEKKVLLLPSHHLMDTLPWKFSKIALLLPFAIDRVEKASLAEDLKRNLKMEWLPTNLVVHSITASSARDPVDYQRLEFLGDSVLKVLTSISLFDQHQEWHEGYLAGAKDRIVSNTASSKGAISAHLSRWIVTKTFTGQKWVPKYILSPTPDQDDTQTKSLSTKILADVVEALIGAAFLSKGYTGATECLSAFDFGKDVRWDPMEVLIQNLVTAAEANAKRYHGGYPSNFADLESYLGYTFKNKALLLEALTHLSNGGDSLSTSYQRLEFLGDALLDIVIVDKLYHSTKRELTHIDMHHLKSTCVNAGFLAFLCMGATTEVERTEVSEEGDIQRKIHKCPLYKYLRHSNVEITRADALCNQRYQLLKESISQQLETGEEYPWTDLTKLDAPKHMSDIVESLIAALWVDSNGDFGQIENFIGKLGILKVLERLVRDEVEPDHPMSRFGKYVAGEGRQGVVKYHAECVELEGRPRTWDCEVKVNDRPIIKVEGATNNQHAKTWAAQLGFAIVKKEVEEQKAKDAEEKARKEEEERAKEESMEPSSEMDTGEYRAVPESEEEGSGSVDEEEGSGSGSEDEE
ncbi:P-loop containing nucleoside triphosphate hydrolase protein, partial [Wilcoxina mikolae CBS 423.85]